MKRKMKTNDWIHVVAGIFILGSLAWEPGCTRTGISLQRLLARTCSNMASQASVLWE